MIIYVYINNLDAAFLGLSQWPLHAVRHTWRSEDKLQESAVFHLAEEGLLFSLLQYLLQASWYSRLLGYSPVSTNQLVFGMVTFQTQATTSRLRVGEKSPKDMPSSTSPPTCQLFPRGRPRVLVWYLI